MSGRRVLLRAAPALLAVAALVACASPPTHYYQLAEAPGQPAARAGLTVAVRGIDIPGTLDQTGIARPSGAYQFDFYANELWAEPLADMLRDVMVLNLGQRLPAATVIGSGGAIGAPPDVLVEINVLRFDPDASGQITLSAQIAVKSGGGELWLTRNFTGAAPAAGAAVTDMVATMSVLWGLAADQTAAMITAAAANPS